MQENEKVFSVSLDIGADLLRSGADVHRVEQTVSMINDAYGNEKTAVFSINSLIVATTEIEGQSYTQSRRITSYSTNLDHLEDLNALSRKICSERPSGEEAQRCFDALKKNPDRKEHIYQLLGYILSAGGFCVFFGGSMSDCIVSMIIACLLRIVDVKLRPNFPNRLVYTIITAAIMGILACASVKAGIAAHADKIMIGDIMLQIPGLVLINGLRDMLLGDTMTGIMRGIEAILTALAIASGFAISLLLFKLPSTNVHNGFVVNIIFAVISTLGFSMMFNVKYKRLLPAVICGTITSVLFVLLTQWSNDMFLCCVLPSVICGFISEILARVIKAPTSVFLLPGLIVLVPGNALYYTMYSIVSGDPARAMAFGNLCLHEAIGIVIGVVVSSIFTIIYMQIKKHQWGKNKNW